MGGQKGINGNFFSKIEKMEKTPAKDRLDLLQVEITRENQWLEWAAWTLQFMRRRKDSSCESSSAENPAKTV